MAQASHGSGGARRCKNWRCRDTGTVGGQRRRVMDEREAMERLRGADPAAGRTPDEERLAHLVEAWRSAAGEAQAGGENAGAVDENARAGDEHARSGDEHARSGGEHAPAGDELAARRSRRLLPVAAAAVVALAVGGAGYAVGRSVDDPPPNAEPTVGRVLDGTGMATAVPEIGVPGIGYLGGGRTSFTSSGLSSEGGDRKSTRLNSSHVAISYAVFCLKK